MNPCTATHHAPLTTHHSSRTTLMAALVVLLPAGALGAEPEPGPPKVPAKLAQARLETARKTYEAVWKNNREGLLPFVELAYRWSCRWLESELELCARKEERVAAYYGHSNRMKDLEKITLERFRAKVIPLEERSATEYYSMEAEVWLIQERQK